MARSGRYVALGLAHARSSWFRDVARWSNAAAVPVEFLKCLTVEEVRARLRTGRPLSALLVDARVPGLDRDLIDDAVSCGCAVIVVDDGIASRDWVALGASAVLPADFDRDDLLGVLAAHAVRVGLDEAIATPREGSTAREWRGTLVAVTGTPGAGVSTAAMALAQGYGDDVRSAGLVVLADFALDADQALLHDAGDIVPGVQELVDAHRAGQPAADDVRSLTLAVTDRGYDLLLGLRRHRDWTAIRPRAFAAALDSLRQAYTVVVADVTADFEGERECGSMDVEERNLMARTVVRAADVVVVVSVPGLRGIGRLVRTLHALAGAGVDGHRVLPVVNRAPRNPRARSEITAAIAQLAAGTMAGREPAASPVFLPDRRRLEELAHRGAVLPGKLVQPLTRAVDVMVERASASGAAADGEPVPVEPGSLGSWYDEEPVG